MKFQTMIRINGVATFLSPWCEAQQAEAVVEENLCHAIKTYETRTNNTIPPSEAPPPQVFHIEIAIGRQPS